MRMFLVALFLTLAAAAPSFAATATCVDPSGTWRVTWSATNAVATLTKLESKTNAPGAVFVDASTQTWEMRWENPASAYGPGYCQGPQACSAGPCPTGEICNAFSGTCGSLQSCITGADCPTGEQDCWFGYPSFQPQGSTGEGLQGTLSVLKLQPVALSLSPRVVAPNGGCTVYMNPYANGLSTWKRAAVFGDSLTASLNDATFNQTSLQGYVQGNLNTASLKAEVEGQSGRGWTGLNLFVDPTGQTPLQLANLRLLDELRGLHTQANIRALVIALGANDAGWVAANCIDPCAYSGGNPCTPPPPCTTAEQQVQLDSRLSTVQSGINAVLDEVVGWGKCVVLVTAPDNLARYGTDNPWAYAWAAQNINSLLRARANASTTDKLLLRDFATLSAAHHTWNTDNWFLPDDLHLIVPGKLVLTSEIVQGALSCP